MSTSNQGLGAVYTSSTGAIADTFSALGNIAGALKSISFKVKATSTLGVLPEMKQLLLDFGVPAEELSDPAVVMSKAKELIASIEAMM